MRFDHGKCSITNKPLDINFILILNHQNKFGKELKRVTFFLVKIHNGPGIALFLHKMDNKLYKFNYKERTV